MKIKKLLPVCLLLILPVVVFGQNKAKFGHVNYTDIMKKMPGVDTAQTAILDFQQELQMVGEEMAKEFQGKQEEYQKLSATTSPTVLKLKEEELKNLYQRIQEYSQSMQTELQQKQITLLKPFQEKVVEAIKEVAKAGGFTYVFDVSTLTYYQQGEDLTDKVIAKLGIKQ